MLDQPDMEKHGGRTLQALSVRTLKSVRQKVSSLSGGQRQTVAIARAVLQEAKVVILDEPTAALGVAQTEQVLALVRRLADSGTAVLIISHNLADVFEVADYINVLYLGNMVAQLETKNTTYDEVVGWITGSKIKDPADQWKASDMTDIRTGPRPRRSPPQPVTGDRAPATRGAVSEQFQNYFQRVRSGEMGMLPALAGVLVLGVLFSFLSEFFLTNKNIANLMTQTAALMILAIALTFLLIMAEIDLSAGITGGVGMAVFIRLLNDQQLELDRSRWSSPCCAGVVIGSIHRLLRREDRGPVVRRDAGPVPGLPGPDARPARRRGLVPHRGRPPSPPS